MKIIKWVCISIIRAMVSLAHSLRTYTHSPSLAHSTHSTHPLTHSPTYLNHPCDGIVVGPSHDDGVNVDEQHEFGGLVLKT